LIGNTKGEFASYSSYHLAVMLGAAAFVVFVLLPAYVAGQLMSTDAKCLSGYEWVCFILQISVILSHISNRLSVRWTTVLVMSLLLLRQCAHQTDVSVVFFKLCTLSQSTYIQNLTWILYLLAMYILGPFQTLQPNADAVQFTIQR
jgi:hypothetical protein